MFVINSILCGLYATTISFFNNFLKYSVTQTLEYFFITSFKGISLLKLPKFGVIEPVNICREVDFPIPFLPIIPTIVLCFTIGRENNSKLFLSYLWMESSFSLSGRLTICIA